MAFNAVPLPFLATLFDNTAVGQGGYPGPLPNIGSVLTGLNNGGDPAPLPHLGLNLRFAGTLATASGFGTPRAVAGSIGQILGGAGVLAYPPALPGQGGGAAPLPMYGLLLAATSSVGTVTGTATVDGRFPDGDNAISGFIGQIVGDSTAIAKWGFGNIGEVFGSSAVNGISPVDTGVPQAGGKGGKRKRTFVEIDGQLFPVASIEEAAALLTQAKATATAHADAVAKELIAKSEPAPSPTVAVSGTTPDMGQLQAMVDAARAEIEAIYADAYHKAMQAAIQQDEDDIEMLLLS